MVEPTPVRAAGAVVFRPGTRVLLVHRPKYDDWSFPKGKLDRGEHAVAAAVREVAEETGLHVRLGPPLAGQRYPLESSPREKCVDYWTARVVGDPDDSGFVPNSEVDEVVWLPADEARRRLTYDRDRETLDDALGRRQRTTAVVVLRHGDARSRRAWRQDDRERPLVVKGHLQAQRLVPLLAAYDVRRVVSSTSERCLQTVAPYADVCGAGIDRRRRLSEEDATPKRARRLVEELAEEAQESGDGVVVCSHRPVLPALLDGLGLPEVTLAPAEMLVAHLRKGRVRAVERHRAH